MAVKYGNQSGLQLASTHRAPDHPLLEGDIHALSMIDLDQVGLGYYKDKLGFSSTAASTSASAAAAVSATYDQSAAAQAIAQSVSQTAISEHYQLDCPDQPIDASEILNYGNNC